MLRYTLFKGRGTPQQAGNVARRKRSVVFLHSLVVSKTCLEAIIDYLVNDQSQVVDKTTSERHAATLLQHAC